RRHNIKPKHGEDFVQQFGAVHWMVPRFYIGKFDCVAFRSRAGFLRTSRFHLGVEYGDADSPQPFRFVLAAAVVIRGRQPGEATIRFLVAFLLWRLGGGFDLSLYLGEFWGLRLLLR